MQSLKDRPRMTSKGTISMSPRLSAISKAPAPMRSFIASVIGATHGAIFSSRVPGKKPSERPAGTLGRVITTLETRRWRRRSAAWVAAMNVLPVPAGPITTTCSAVASARM